MSEYRRISRGWERTGRVASCNCPGSPLVPWSTAVSVYLTFGQHRGLPVTSQATGSLTLASPLWPPVRSKME